MTVDIDSEMKLKEHLDRDEKLIWTGSQQKGLILRKADIFLIPFSLLWCGFAIFWVIGASKAGGLFGLFGVPFVIIGLIFVFGRFIIDSKQRENTVYGITQERIIVKSGVFKQTVKSYNIRTLTNIELTENSNGSGTIFIGPKKPMNIMSEGMEWWSGMKSTPSLTLIPDVRKVYRQIVELQKSN